ncbi:hypothetical protein ACOMHN_058929 [Nucella lapillus]
MPTETEPWGPFDSDIRVHTGSVHCTPHCSPQSSAPDAIETELQQLKTPTEVKRVKRGQSKAGAVVLVIPAVLPFVTSPCPGITPRQIWRETGVTLPGPLSASSRVTVCPVCAAGWLALI